jgi:hypothetical protein
MRLLLPGASSGIRGREAISIHLQAAMRLQTLECTYCTVLTSVGAHKIQAKETRGLELHYTRYH